MTVHHRNLVSFIGYCDDDKMALIYEHMANGNLKHYLSGKSLSLSSNLQGKHEHLHLRYHIYIMDADINSHGLSWEKRLEIAIDAAHGQ